MEEIVMNKDRVKGRIKEAEGKVKEVTGKVVGNQEARRKGQASESRRQSSRGAW
jgi:uncharacterized protein YjbJ (UPF0337 family)